MKLINIYPMGNLCMELTQDYHMFLTHMVEKYPLYEMTAQKSKGYKILDNSLIELGDSVDIERVLSAAKRICADEIILPDAFQDGPRTLISVQESLAYLRKKYPQKNWPYKLMAVAQGRNEEEWYKCYRELLSIPEIDVIGIPKVLAKMHPKGRPYFVNNLCELGKIEHHLLGLWYSLSELREYDNPQLIRSCDTVLLGFMAKYGLHVSGVRPDGFTVNLERDVVDYTQVFEELEDFLDD